ncbi:MAG: Crp/Fnr family transcriptional regulator [Pseudolabrys sp.]|nr:Crp/Fnr family transcriptional regulator [Pseudolabrys sp.]
MNNSKTYSPPRSGCDSCILDGLGLCNLAIDCGRERPPKGGRANITQGEKTQNAKRTIFSQNEPVETVAILCDGWAASTLRISKGRKQILSFLLPGEMLTFRALFESGRYHSTEAITPVSYRVFDQSQFRNAMFASQNIFDRIMAGYSEERCRADQMIVDLGQRSATERIARLLLDIWTRLEKSGKVKDNSIAFPLRQTHIADATGLTNVYVGKVLTAFRNERLISITGRTLTMLDIDKLRRQAA